jgi:hypothetical protein
VSTIADIFQSMQTSKGTVTLLTLFFIICPPSLTFCNFASLSILLSFSFHFTGVKTPLLDTIYNLALHMFKADGSDGWAREARTLQVRT